MPVWVFMLDWGGMLLLALLSERGLALWGADRILLGSRAGRIMRLAGRLVGVGLLAAGLKAQGGMDPSLPMVLVTWVGALGFAAPMAALTLSGLSAWRTARLGG
ncbi:hypothetical protein [Acetobacter papayae]|uniref:hypothetical protein n=1 Tax=Acetobacter papayae TaxID=1076592 RepID=UPI00046EAE8A|nr:hypothetical protein [Acetobacter papayae]